MRARIGSSLKWLCRLERPTTSSSSSAIAVRPGGTRRFGRRARVSTGQSQSDDILIDVRRRWYGGEVEDDGRRVRARPGTIHGHINSLLERHGRRLGPDPASSHACTIGGVIANNAGGMRVLTRNWLTASLISCACHRPRQGGRGYWSI
jgi:FAD/FMN-containing dehydrogenase